MRKENYSKRVFTRLQAHRGEISNLCFLESILKPSECAGGPDRQRLGHVGKVTDGEEASLAVGAVVDVFSSAAAGQNFKKFCRESALHRRQQAAPALGNVDDGTPG